MADITPDSLRSMLTEILGTGGNSAPKQAAAGATGSISSNIEQFKQLATAMAPVISGMATLGKNTEAAYSALDKLAGMGGRFSGELQGMVKALSDSSKQMGEATKIGIGANKFPELMASTAKAGTTIDEHTQTLKRSQGAFNSLSGTQQGVSKALLDLQKDTQETRIGKQLKEQGQEFVTTLKQSAEIMASGSKDNIATDAAARKRMAESSAALAAELDLTSKATGLSRETLAEELKERLKQPKAIMAMNQMTEEQRQAFIRTQASLSGLGETTQNLAQKIASGGRLSAEDRQALNAMGPAAGQFQRAIRMQQQAGNDPERRRQADEALARARDEINRFQSSARYSAIAQQSDSPVAQTMVRMFAENRERAGQQAQQRTMGEGTTPAQAREAIRQETTRQQQGRTPTGDVDREQQIGREFNKLQEQARLNAAGAAESFNRLNKEAARNPAIMDSMTGAIKKFSDTAFGTAKTAEEAADKQKAAVQGVRDKVTGGVAATPTPPQLGAPGTRLEPKSREHGSIGTVQKLVEDFRPNEMIKVHPNEGVHTKKQLEDIIDAARSSVMPKKEEPKDNIVGAIKTMATDMFKTKDIAIEAPKPTLPFKMPEVAKEEPKEEPNVTTAAAEQPVVNKEETVKMPEAATEEEASLSDVANLLAQLNKSISKMVSLTESINDASNKTAKFSSKLTGNRAVV